MKLIFECPKLLSIKLDKSMEELFYIFDLYHKIEKETVINDIFKNFPYLFCCDPVKIQKFMGQFRKYRLTKEQIINLSANSGGLLATKVSNF